MAVQVAVLAIQLGVILVAARFFGMMASKVKVPPVMGELLTGILLGPYCLGSLSLGLSPFEHGLFPLIAHQSVPMDTKLYSIATLGSILLLFVSGLETDVRTFFKYSVVGTVVGIGGVLCSFFCGAAVGCMLGWQFMDPRTLFLGILCTATSVGISARILSEHKAMGSPEGVTIMAAAVIDDVLGIVCLAVVVGLAGVNLNGGRMSWGAIAWISVKSFGIWLGVTAIGLLLSRRIAGFLKLFKSSRVFAVIAFGLSLILAGLFEQAGLAMIVGAFVMGLSLSKTDIAFKIRDKLDPICNFLVPVFFVVMGMLVDVRVLKDPQVLTIGLLFSAMAIIGKVVGCFFPALLMNFNLVGSLRIGVGMVPRCEVVLIIAGIAATSMMKNPALEKCSAAVGNLPQVVPIFDSKLFGVAIIMTLVTALLAPPLLDMALSIRKKGIRREVPDATEITTDFSFPNEAITLSVLNTILDLFTHDGFMHSLYSKGIRVIQFRRENTQFSLQIKHTTLAFTSNAADVPLIKAAVYEAIVELHQSLSDLRQLATPENIRNELFIKAEEAKPTNRETALLSKVISTDNIIVGLKGATKEEVFRELLDTIDSHCHLHDKTLCSRDLLEREREMSTYQGDGIAMPHARTTGTEKFISAIGIKPEGIPYDDDSDNRAQIVILSLCPRYESGPYLQFIAQIAKVLSDKDKRQALISAKDAQEVKEIITRKA
ncbi:MAG: cation:proton antiporter [Lentisphaeria bacterium]|nr:cation:proton antiporter [Lentisphaeria bacterium]